jgi:NCAIR mutase (PurE)-related protein
MNKKRLKELLISVARGEIDVESALETLRFLPYEDIGFAKIDHHRGVRRDFPEVVFCSNKTVSQIVEIAQRIIKEGDDLIMTRCNNEVYLALKDIDKRIEYHELARMITLVQKRKKKEKGMIAILSAGTSDMPVAEEARVTAEVLGNTVEVMYDVGVAGIHRLFSAKEMITKARVFIVVAGMEGALASVVGGLVNKPIIAVPTSIGYGASFQGLTALLGMLNSCASGVTVVNIDNGFGAGFAASLMNRL